jgi:hypothetical protein
MAKLPPEASILLVGLLAILVAAFRGISGCCRMLWKVLGLEPKRNAGGRWPAWAELCSNVLFFVVLVALAYGASTRSGALYYGSVAVSLVGIARALSVLTDTCCTVTNFGAPTTRKQKSAPSNLWTATT